MGEQSIQNKGNIPNISIKVWNKSSPCPALSYQMHKICLDQHQRHGFFLLFSENVQSMKVELD